MNIAEAIRFIEFVRSDAVDPNRAAAAGVVLAELERLQAVEHAARSYLTSKGVDMIGWGRELCELVGVDPEA